MHSTGVALRHKIRLQRRGLEGVQLTRIYVPLADTVLLMNSDLFVVCLMTSPVTQTI
jgi:hypothetical protein